MFEWISNNINLILAIVSAIGAGVSTFFGIKYKGTKQATTVQVLSKLVNAFPSIIQVAEKVGDDGESRKTWALEQAVLLCKSMGLDPSEEQLAEMSNLIDKLVALSKAINNAPSTPSTHEYDNIPTTEPNTQGSPLLTKLI